MLFRGDTRIEVSEESEEDIYIPKENRITIAASEALKIKRLFPEYYEDRLYLFNILELVSDDGVVRIPSTLENDSRISEDIAGYYNGERSKLENKGYVVGNIAGNIAGYKLASEGAFYKNNSTYNPVQNDLSKVANSENETKNVFPSNPDDLLPEISRNKITKPNGTISQTIYTSDGFRIRAEQHALLPGEVYNPRHHGVHYHLEYKVDLTKSWNNKNNVHKLYPNGYTNGSGSGFLPGEAFPN